MRILSIMSGLFLPALLIPLTVMADLEPPYHPMFDGDAVQEIRIDFYDGDFWNILADNFEDEIYLEASFQWEEFEFDTIGVRFKGGSSYMSNPTMKKSFKLDFDVFVEGQTLLGLRKINLNCNFNDPSFVREVSAYELSSEAGLPTLRTTFCALYINDTYWGLYTLVEQFDGAFIEDHFGSSEDGNLWKGDDHGTLEFLGWSPGSYYTEYELKTNEELNDWTDLIELTDRLNNTPVEYLPDTLSEVMDVNTALALLAMDNFLVNLDSYAGRGVNFYLYHMDRDDRFVFGEWDMNESWGIYNSWDYSISDLQTLDPYWVNPSVGEDRPLADILYGIDDYREVYEGHILRLMAGGADPDVLVDRMEDLRDLIRDWVYLEVAPRRLFTPANFEAAMDQNVQIGPGRYAPALETFVRNRDSWLINQLGSWNPVDGLVLNELMASNDTTIADEYDEYDDWAEIANCGSGDINLSGFFLTDDMADPFKFAFPDTVIHPGGYFIVWADDTPAQGSMHAGFKLDKDGEELYLLQGAIIVDQTTYPEIETDVSWGRWPDCTGPWYMLAQATPGAENTGGTGIGDFGTLDDPVESMLSIVSPNPISHSAVLTVLGAAGDARLDVYDISGRLVATPFDGYMNCSEAISWDASGLATGAYILRLVQDGEMVTRLVTLIQ